jgi:L,D-peptidoglycan transpeptidase YkuD (ErfK/YbiS/YcfS/YnhG family)
MRASILGSGPLCLGGEAYRAALGWGGVRVDKREGDGATPAGTLPLREVFYRPDRGIPPDCAVPVRALTPHDGWCDDPASAAYNRLVMLPTGASAEVLWRDDTIYDIIGVLSWNDAPVVPGRGSAIFLHIAKPNYTPTDGCVALAEADLRQVLKRGLTEIVIMP